MANFRKSALILFIAGFMLAGFMNAGAETLTDEEKEIIEQLDLYMDYSFWKDASGDEILAVSKEDWEMLEAVEYYEEGENYEE